MAKVSCTSIVGVLILLASFCLFVHTFDEAYQKSVLTVGRGPVFFPRIILGAMLLLSLIVTFRSNSERDNTANIRISIMPIAAMTLTGCYIFSIDWAGFILPTLLFTFLMPLILGYHNWKITLGLSVLYTFVIWYVFDRVFLIILPSSPWFEVI